MISTSSPIRVQRTRVAGLAVAAATAATAMALTPLTWSTGIGVTSAPHSGWDVAPAGSALLVFGALVIFGLWIAERGAGALPKPTKLALSLAATLELAALAVAYLSVHDAGGIQVPQPAFRWALAAAAASCAALATIVVAGRGHPRADRETGPAVPQDRGWYTTIVAIPFAGLLSLLFFSGVINIATSGSWRISSWLEPLVVVGAVAVASIDALLVNRVLLLRSPDGSWDERPYRWAPWVLWVIAIACLVVWWGAAVSRLR